MASEPRLRGSSGGPRLARVAGWLAIALTAAPAAWAGFDPAATFAMKCAGCHSVGKGVVVGPDLAGVTARRDKRWLHAFIRSSQGLVGRGDETATTLFSKFKKRMPDHDFSDAEIDSLLAFIEAGGPRDAGGEIRRASLATPGEVARGRDLFSGRYGLRNGGAACAGCHTAGGLGPWRSGTLASDLTRVFDKYQDAGLTRALVESRFPLMATAYHGRPLTSDEVFTLKAFLYATARSPEQPVEMAPGTPLFLGFGGSSLVLLFTGRILRRRGGPGGLR
ncbi:MAG TPA: cytochrome c [Thermoanaerobaculia bacterium]|jgi:mono/diheme cytochrome c family protein|nr:cytochrome c [Thermoanaerobaculia bacterium]